MLCGFRQWTQFPAEIESIGSRDSAMEDTDDIFDSHITTKRREGVFQGSTHSRRLRAILWENNLLKYLIPSAGSE
jgi:hypothetical protein